MDPLSELFKEWRPAPLHPASRLARKVMGQIHRETKTGNGAEAGWERFLDEWLPSPKILVPACAALILMVAIFQWGRAQEQAREIAALQWHEEISKPLGQVSLSGTLMKSNLTKSRE